MQLDALAAPPQPWSSEKAGILEELEVARVPSLHIIVILDKRMNS